MGLGVRVGVATELKPLLDHVHGRHDQVVRYLVRGRGRGRGRGKDRLGLPQDLSYPHP